MKSLLRYSNQYVRDLAWVLLSPGIMQTSASDKPSLNSARLVDQYFKVKESWLAELDRKPERLVNYLTDKNLFMLGTYFEALWSFFLNHYPDYHLVGKNCQVIADKETLGEFDFIYGSLADKAHYHLEVAVKYYLGVPALNNDFTHNESSGETTLLKQWIGPATRDRLDKKYNKLLTQQSQLSQMKAGMNVLAGKGVTQVQAQICLLGYLFYPLDTKMRPPVGAHLNHNQGFWLREDALEKITEPGTLWSILAKPHWLSPNIKNGEYLLQPNALLASVKNHFVNSTHPILISLFKEIPSKYATKYSSNQFYSTELFFVVPPKWPEKSA
ncbi:DUF1853 family protein [Aliikangiella sp. IMCC44359]|uniref:DUF1853 family protein n=1 Tax=Aliikangiella sp. IMCC44359 TaxID=3459125 RepID=UPI00403B2E80